MLASELYSTEFHRKIHKSTDCQTNKVTYRSSQQPALTNADIQTQSEMYFNMFTKPFLNISKWSAK